jgi:hypothetical protein
VRSAARVGGIGHVHEEKESTGARSGGTREHMIHGEAEGLDRLERAAVCERCTASSTVAEVCNNMCPRSSAGQCRE